MKSGVGYILHQACKSWQRRLGATAIALFIGAVWLPTTLYLRGFKGKLTSPVQCYMKPEFYRDGGVSAEQICSGGQLDFRAVTISMGNSLEIVIMLIGVLTILAWIIKGSKYKAPVSPPQPPKLPPPIPTYVHRETRS